MPKEIRIKGTAFIGVVRALGTLRGKPVCDAALDELRGEGGEALRTGTVLASGWYPCEWYRDLLGAAERTVSEGPAFVRELGRISTRESVSAIHRIFMRMLSPDTLMKQGARVFATFYEAELAVQSVAPGEARVVWSGCHGFDKNCWLDQLGATDQLVTMSGAKLPRIRVLTGGNTGDPDMSVECLWRA